MVWESKTLNLVLSGGGVKGIAFAGAFEVAEQRGYDWGNIAGVSAGAIAGALTGAGYSAQELWKVLQELEFDEIEINDIPKKVPAVTRYARYRSNFDFYRDGNVRNFLYQYRPAERSVGGRFQDYRKNLLQNIIIFSKEGCLYDGDYLEEWVYKALLKKGIKTFGDLRNGVADKANPKGYKVRMTAVDANRGKVIILPDDISFYGMNPDRLEVAKAARMSSSVPFAFKPVELKKKEGDSQKTYHIVDGGVLNNFPFWLVEGFGRRPSAGFRLYSKESNKIISLNTPLKILKALILEVHDSGVPKSFYDQSCVAQIETTKVPYLDFNLSDNEKRYLQDQGRRAAELLFDRFQGKTRGRRRVSLFYLLSHRGRF